MTSVEQTITLKEYVAYLTGPYSDELGDKKRLEQLEDAQKGINELHRKAVKEIIKDNPEARDMSRTLRDLNILKELLQPTSLKLIKEADDEITKVANALQNMVSYNPKLYYNLYFLLVGSSVNPELSLDIKDIPAFRTWFKGSEVVDKDGNPKVVYHGTGGDEFTQFSFKLFPGIYFAEDKKYSEWFRKMKGGKGTLFSCYLRVLNPLDLSVFKTESLKYDDLVYYLELKYGFKLPENKMAKAVSDKQKGIKAWQYLRMSPNWLKYIRDNSAFDGVKFYENNPDEKIGKKERVTLAYMVFKANQIKEATGNMIFSLASEDIRFKKGGSL